MELLRVLIDLVKKNNKGKEMWQDLVLSKAINIIKDQRPPSGNYPAGLFQSSKTKNHQFLSHDTHQEYTARLAKDGMPFLYNLLNQVLVESTSQELSDTLGHNILTTSTVNDKHAEGLQLEGISYEMSHEDHFTGSHQCDLIASTVCGMIAYARNRRHNGIQL
ncbi:hypothetical protein PCASD_16590 [Puccinia coronata f. sp. avenae]|uniref:Uncharacterized protein n=1 Tax=Puccinia coronata f. sp. avenae TaxID=200324 RepID=A0A2N5TWM7_9BASI|nr:hypothetical protein PCASD_16590 [Puccinia coronata f. sp. avenae]